MISDEEVMKYIEKQERKLKQQEAMICASLIFALVVIALMPLCIGEHGIIPSICLVLAIGYASVVSYFDNKKEW